MSTVAALIIADGKTPRRASFNPLEEVGSITAVSRIVRVFARANVERVVVVCGENSRDVEKSVAFLNVVCLPGPKAPDAQMFDFVKAGLRYLQGKCEKVLVAPVSSPLFGVETVNALCDCEAEACIPVCDGHAGHPLLLSAGLIPKILGYHGDYGLGGALRALGVVRERVSVADEGVLASLDGKTDIGELVGKHSLRKIQPEVRLRLAREKAFFGPGTQQLLMLMHETGSIKQACRYMGISYSKGWKMVTEAEHQLGFVIAARQKGGADGGHSALTPRGEELLNCYAKFVAEVKKDAKALFEKHFGKLEL